MSCGYSRTRSTSTSTRFRSSRIGAGRFGGPFLLACARLEYAPYQEYKKLPGVQKRKAVSCPHKAAAPPASEPDARVDANDTSQRRAAPNPAPTSCAERAQQDRGATIRPARASPIPGASASIYPAGAQLRAAPHPSSRAAERSRPTQRTRAPMSRLPATLLQSSATVRSPTWPSSSSVCAFAA